MNPDFTKPNYKAHPGDEGIDRIELVVVPRYKTSGLSRRRVDHLGDVLAGRVRYLDRQVVLGLAARALEVRL